MIRPAFIGCLRVFSPASSFACTTENTEITENAKMEVNEVTDQVIGAAIEVHRTLGPGLLESVYQACFAREFPSVSSVPSVVNPPGSGDGP